MAIIYFKNNYGIKSVSIDPWSNVLQAGEEVIIWSHDEQKGLLFKHVSALYRITNFRIFVYDIDIEKMAGLLMMPELDDVVVTDTYRTYSSTRYGMYSDFARGFGVTGGQSQGRSVTVGRIVFMSNGRPIISINGIADPNGLKRLVLAVKKALYPKKEIQRFLTGLTDKNPSIVRNTSICLRCGSKNVKDASFCHTCGAVLR